MVLECLKDRKTYFQEIPSFALLRQTRLKMATHTRRFPQFYKDLSRGNLASYTYLEPYFGELPNHNKDSNDGHAGGAYFHKAEQLLKEVYENVRKSPKWNSTVLLITFDEHGGFFDHVVPPFAPNPDGIISSDSKGEYRFNRLGVRIPVIAISPRVKKGHVIHQPSGPYATSQYEHSSIPATLRAMFNLSSPPLTKREAWAGKFDNIFTEEIRTDCPMKMPETTK